MYIENILFFILISVAIFGIYGVIKVGERIVVEVQRFRVELNSVREKIEGNTILKKVKDLNPEK
jgi:hypothetical protein